MLAYSAVGFKLSAVSLELTLSLAQLSADLAGCTGRCRCNSSSILFERSVLLHWAVQAFSVELSCELSADSAGHTGPTGRCNNFLPVGVI